MKITDKRLSGNVKFSELKIGDCYKDGPDVFMKIMEVTAENDMKINCVCLNSGLPYYQYDHSIVVGVDSELILRTRNS